MRGFASVFMFFVAMAICTTVVQWFYTPTGADDPVMIVAGLVIPALVVGGLNAAQDAREEREKRKALDRQERLELEKHRMTLEYAAGKRERPRDDTRLGPEFLKAFEKPEAGNGRPAAVP